MILITKLTLSEVLACFRLLNSEIGNDHTVTRTKRLRSKCFRLLNSEIGNDRGHGFTGIHV